MKKIIFFFNGVALLGSLLLMISPLLLADSIPNENQQAETQQENANLLTGPKLQVLSASAGTLLTLEDQPPADGSTAIPITAEIECSILNLLTLNQGLEDYFHLFTPKLGAYIDDQITIHNIYNPRTRKVSLAQHLHHYVVRPGKAQEIVGYLKGLDKNAADQVVLQTAAKNNALQYYFDNSAQGTTQWLLINLQYGFLSQSEMDARNLMHSTLNHDDELSGIYYDFANQGTRAEPDHIVITESSQNVKIDIGADRLAPVKSNLFSLALFVSLNNAEGESDFQYGAADSDQNQWGKYNDTNDTAPVSSAAATK